MLRSTIKKYLVDARDTLTELIENFDKDDYIASDKGSFNDQLASVNLAIARVLFYTANDEEEFLFKDVDENKDAVKEENKE